MEKIKLNTPIEVSLEHYNLCKKHLRGFVAYRKDEEGNFWIKPMTLGGGIRKVLEQILSI